MTQTDRMQRVLRGEKVDRPPVITVCTSITKEVQEKAGIYLPQAHADAAMMAALAETVRNEFQTENFKVPFDMTSEAELLGAGVDIGGPTSPPQVRGKQPLERSFLDTYAGAKLAGRGRVGVITEAVSMLHDKYRGEVPILGGVVGPTALLGMLFGFNDLFLTIHDDEELFADLMAFAIDMGAQHAKALVAAGAQSIQIGEAAASGDLIGPEMYRDLIMPWHTKMIEAIPAPVVMHICGNNNKNIQSFAALPASVLSLDEKTDFGSLREATRGKTALIGCVPVSLLLDGTEEEVFRSARWYMEQGADIISSACSLPPFSPTRNVQAMSRAVLQN